MKESSVFNLIISGESYPLNKTKLLLGTSDNCDIKLSHDTISHYHAMIFIGGDGQIQVMDLQSQNGTYINGERVHHQHSQVFEGDSLSFGKLHCEVIPSFEAVQVANQDATLEIVADLQSDKIYIPKPSNDNEVLIDDEYCDIKFDDDQFVPLFKNPLTGHFVDGNDFIETDSLEQSYDLLEEIDGNCIQVSTTLSGSILEQYYFPITDGTIYAGNSHKNGVVQIDTLENEKPSPFFKVQGDTIEMFDINGFNITTKTMTISETSVIVLSKGPYQVFIEVGNVPSNLIHISPLRRDKEFFKETAKKFAAVIVPMLLLLLVDFAPDKKKVVKQLSIIYKKPTKANIDGKKLSSTNPNDTKKNTGHKDTKQPDKKIAHSKSGQKAQPKKAQAKKVTKKVAKATPKTKSAKSPTKAKRKAYSFKMASNVSSAFSSAKNVTVTKSTSSSSVSTTSSVSGSLSTKVNGTTSNQVGNMGSDSAGRALASFGSKGLSSKSGRDTAYIQTETVVLGSMDPELLRKILQQYLPQFRHCYQQELAYNSEDIKGIVDLNFEILGSGKVSNIKVKAKDSRFSKRGINCMAKVLAIIDFPKPKGGGRVAVRQPLSFFSEQEKS